jgi:hypothetical protein
MKEREPAQGEAKPKANGQTAAWVARAGGRSGLSNVGAVVSAHSHELQRTIRAQTARTTAARGSSLRRKAHCLRIETKEVIVPLSAYDAEGNLVGDLAPTDVLRARRRRAAPGQLHPPRTRQHRADSWIQATRSARSKTARPSANRKSRVELWKNQRYQLLPRHGRPRIRRQIFVSKLAPADQVAIIQYADRVHIDAGLDARHAAKL